MAREVITRKDLQEWMTYQVSRFEGCEDVTVGGITPLQQPDDEGVNWSDNLVLRVTGVPKEIYEPAFAKVLREARARFNIKEE